MWISVNVSNALTIYSEVDNNQIHMENVTALVLKAGTASVGTTFIGNSRVELNGVSVLTTATLNGASGDNHFDIRGTFGNLIVNGGTGNDTVRIHDSSVVGLLAVTESSLSTEQDVVSLSYVNVLGYASVTTGRGSDSVSFDHVSVGNYLTIKTDEGMDHFTLTNTAADYVFWDLGAGTDYLLWDGFRTIV